MKGKERKETINVDDRKQCPHCEGFIAPRNFSHHFNNCPDKPFELPARLTAKAIQPQVTTRVDHIQYSLLMVIEDLDNLESLMKEGKHPGAPVIFTLRRMLGTARDVLVNLEPAT